MEIVLQARYFKQDRPKPNLCITQLSYIVLAIFYKYPPPDRYVNPGSVVLIQPHNTQILQNGDSKHFEIRSTPTSLKHHSHGQWGQRSAWKWKWFGDICDICTWYEHAGQPIRLPLDKTPTLCVYNGYLRVQQWCLREFVIKMSVSMDLVDTYILNCISNRI